MVAKKSIPNTNRNTFFVRKKINNSDKINHENRVAEETSTQMIITDYISFIIVHFHYNKK